MAENGGDKTGGRLALCGLALCRVPRGAKRWYGRIRTATDSNGQVRTINLLERCDKPMGVAAGGDKAGGRLALCRLPRGAKPGYGRRRTATDKYGQ